MLSRLRSTLIAIVAATAGCGIAASAASAAGAIPRAVGGQKVTVVASGLHTPTAFAHGDGTLFVADGGAEVAHAHDGGVFRVSGGAARRLTGSPVVSLGITWHQGSLYVGGEWLRGGHPVWHLERWSGFTGKTFTRHTVIYTAPTGYQGFNGLAFGPDGRLYAGSDVGLNNGNDHGPASLSPYLYDILSFPATGGAPQVFATGIRQPFQMVFAPGSTSPLVSDLGPDYDQASTPYDLILRVSAGQDYQFPDCIRSPATTCASAPAPFAYAAHDNIVGMAIIGHTLYMTSFFSLDPSARVGELLKMPLAGGSITPEATNFPAQAVGLGAVGHTLYFGDGTGRVYSLTP